MRSDEEGEHSSLLPWVIPLDKKKNKVRIQPVRPPRKRDEGRIFPNSLKIDVYTNF